MAKSPKFTAAELQIITSIQEERNSTRKAAAQYFKRHRDEYMRKNAKAATAPAVDMKQRAANDKSEQADAVNVPGIGTVKLVSAPKTKTYAQSSVLATPEQRGVARAEGLRLYKLAGKPKKSDFIRVFGRKGVAWTWEARAKAIGLASAEECAEKFQSLLKKASR